jgi:hypothetical protein
MFGLVGTIKTYIILGIAAASTLGVAYWYYTDTQKAFKTYEDNANVMNQAITIQTQALTQLNQDFEQMKSVMSDLNKTFAESRERVIKLENKFTKNKKGDSRDFGKIGAKKPKLVEKIINKAVIETSMCFEILSGSEGEYNEETYNSCITIDSTTK